MTVRILKKPELCQSCATGYDRTSCMWFPVPCADRLELWLSGASTERERIAVMVEAHAQHPMVDEAYGDDLRDFAKRIRETRS